MSNTATTILTPHRLVCGPSFLYMWCPCWWLERPLDLGLAFHSKACRGEKVEEPAGAFPWDPTDTSRPKIRTVGQRTDLVGCYTIEILSHLPLDRFPSLDWWAGHIGR